MTLDERIAQAQRHVDSGRLIVERSGRSLPDTKCQPQSIFSTALRTPSRYLRRTWPICLRGGRGRLIESHPGVF